MKLKLYSIIISSEQTIKIVEIVKMEREGEKQREKYRIYTKKWEEPTRKSVRT